MIKKITFLLTVSIVLLLASGCSQHRRHPVEAQAHHQSQPSARQSAARQARQHSQNKRYQAQVRRQTHTRNRPTPRQSTSQRQVSRHRQAPARATTRTRTRNASNTKKKHNNYNNHYNKPVTTARPPHYSHARNRLLGIAKNTLGTRYKYGGTNPRSGFDCSGLMSYIHKQGLGLNIPRTAAAQRDNSRTISYAQLQPGDILFFKTGKRSNHAGIYIGNRQFIHASTSKRRVMVAKMDSKYWHSRFVKFGTFF